MQYPKLFFSLLIAGALALTAYLLIEARSLVSDVISEVEHEDHVLVTWKFRVTLEQNFSYQQYPFEQNDIRVVVLYPDLSRNILLIPDLDSYAILNPSVRPGLNPAVTAPSSKVISSFFTFNSLHYRTTFGSDTPIDTYPALTFTMIAKRI